MSAEETPSWYQPNPDDPFTATVDLSDLGYGQVVVRDVPKPIWVRLNHLKDGDNKLAESVAQFIVSAEHEDPAKWPEPIHPMGSGKVSAWVDWIRITPNRVYNRIERASLILAGLGDPFADRPGAEL